MHPFHRQTSARNQASILLVIALFVFAGVHTWSGNTDTGDDLSSSFIGCRIVASGEALHHLYSHDPTDFTSIGPDQLWPDIADEGNFTGMLHPYVQTPLWAFLLRPLCTRLGFLAFQKVFAVLMLGSLALTVWLIARFWTPSLFHPLPVALTLLLVWFSQPFRYSMFLMQTHALFLCMCIAGLLLAERRRPLLSGFLLAFAASVKLTPCLILLYWLVTRRWRAAASMAGWFVVLTAATIAATGLPLFRLYLSEIGRLGHLLLVAQNNQSFAAWWMAHFYPAAEAAKVTILPLPAGVRIVSSATMLALTLAGAWLDRRHPASRVPLGALIALVAATLFAPIAWTHYFILLIAPLMLFAQQLLDRRTLWLAPFLLGALALSYPPLASDIIDWEIGRFSIVRNQFFAGMLCLIGLALLALERHRSPRPAAQL